MEYSMTLLLMFIMAGPVSCSFACEPLPNITYYNVPGTLCGDGQCYCSDKSASCYGKLGVHIYSTLPVLDKNVTTITARCYNFSYFSRDSFKNINSSNIEELNITQCNMRTVTLDAFSSFGNLKFLKIYGNININHSQLRDAMQAITRTLTNLTLSGNMLRQNQLDIQYFAKFQKLKHLDLSKNEIHSLAGNSSNVSIRSLIYLNLGRNKFHGNDLNFCINTSDNDRVVDGSLSEIKHGLFPELRVLDLGGNYLGGNGKCINETFECLEKLEYLDLSDNTISTVVLSRFSHLANLRTLILSDNWIQNVSGGKMPPTLETIDFRNNQMTPFPPKLCNSRNGTLYPNLKHLDFGRNYIINLTTNWHECMPNIEWLDFGKNDVRQIHNDTFLKYKKLKYLYLGNLIPWDKEIHPSAFKSSSLQNLSLRYNWMNFSSNENLKKIFQFCPNLTWLDVSYNYIESVSLLEDILQPLKALEYLHLEKMHLEFFPFPILTSLTKLKELNVNKNTIYTIIFPDEFNNASLKLNIEFLSVAGCLIHTITQSSFPLSIRKSLKYLNLGDNQFGCGCEMRWFRDAVDKHGVIKNTSIHLVGGKDKYLCRSPRTLGGHLFWTYKPIETCSTISPIFVAFVAGCTTLFVFSVLTVVMIWNRWYIKYWLFKLGRRRRSDEDTDPEGQPLLNEELYDGYVVYNAEDHMFVHHAFRELVENELGYKLHIWERDADLGAKVDVVLNAMYATKHVIVAVSNNILKDQWAKFQVDVAIDKSIKGSSDVLFVKLDNLNPRRINKTWCVLMTRTPTVDWSDNKDNIEYKLLKEVIRNKFGKPLKSEHRPINQ